MWSSTARHRPAAAGTSVGCLPPNRRETGSEKVSLIGASGFARIFGPGETSTTGRIERGNQVSRTGAPSRSHGRTAAASATEPAAVFVGSVTVRPVTAAPATETRSTGASKRHAHGRATRDRQPAVTDRRDR